MMKTPGGVSLTPNTTQSVTEPSSESVPEKLSGTQSHDVPPVAAASKDIIQTISGEKISAIDDTNKTERNMQPPLPATVFGRNVLEGKELLEITRGEHSKDVPVVFIVKKGQKESTEEVTSTLGADFLLSFSGIPVDSQEKNIHSALKDASSIALLLPNGEYKEVETKAAEENDPSGFITEALLQMNSMYPCHSFNDAEIRVTVAAALCIGTFGFTDTELATKITSLIDSESYRIGVHRVFQMSVDYSHHKLAKQMISWGADVNELFEDDGRQPLFTAEKNNDQKMVEILIQGGARRNR